VSTDPLEALLFPVPSPPPPDEAKEDFLFKG